MKVEKAIVVGGGIGGLTLALALSRVGISVEVYERAPELKEIGAGLGVWTNAVKVLDRLGVGGRIREIGMPLRFGEFCTEKGQVVSRMNIENVVKEERASCYVMRRTDLLDAIAEQIPQGVVHTGHECVKIEQDSKGVVAHFANGETARGTLLVGADGINSIVRNHLWGKSKPRYSGQTCFRGIADVAPKDSQVIREIHGTGKRAGICPLSKERVYWFAALNANEGEMIDFSRRRDWLLKEFSGWPFQVPEVIGATPSEMILQNDLVDRAPIPHWTRGRITLLGDAAHPTTPNLGQGACMAIEDALVLTRCLAQEQTLSEAFDAYERERLARTADIVNKSWNYGRMTLWTNPLLVWLREMFVKLTPHSVSERTFREQVGYDAGQLPQAQ